MKGASRVLMHSVQGYTSEKAEDEVLFGGQHLTFVEMLEETGGAD